MRKYEWLTAKKVSTFLFLKIVHGRGTIKPVSTQQLALLESFQKKSINSDQPACQESIWLTCYSISEKKGLNFP